MSESTRTFARHTGVHRAAAPTRPEVPPSSDERTVSLQRTGGRTIATPSAHSGHATTAVLPHVSSHTARRTRRLRAWMLAIPVDFAAMIAPLPWATHHWKGTIFAAFLTVAIFATGGLYRGRRHMSFLDELPSVLGRLLVAAAIVAVIFSQRHDTESYVNGFLHTVVISAGLVLVGRMFTRWAVLFARRRRWVEHGVLIVGSGPVAVELARLLRRYPQYGLRFAGFVDDEGAHDQRADIAPWVGRTRRPRRDDRRDRDRSHHHRRSPACSEDSLMRARPQSARPWAATCWSCRGCTTSPPTPACPDHIGAIPVIAGPPPDPERPEVVAEAGVRRRLRPRSP